MEHSQLLPFDATVYLESIIDSAQEAILSVDGLGQIILFNKGAETVFGYSRDEIIGEPLWRLMPKQFVGNHIEHLQAFAKSSEYSKTMESRSEIHGLRKDGSEFPAEASITKLQTGEGLIFTVFLRDISERKESEVSRERLLEILEKSTDIIGTADPDGNLLYLNKAGREYMGMQKSGALTGLRIVNFQEGWSLSQTLHEGIPYAIRDGAWEGESEIFNHDGKCIPVSQLIMAHKDQNDELLYISCVMRDISERKVDEKHLMESNIQLKEANSRIEEAQSQLLQSEKMASIGQLAAGVAHEINNPMGYISSNLRSLSEYIQDLWQMLDAYEKAESVISESRQQAQIIELKKKIDIAFIREDIEQLIAESSEGANRVKEIVQDLKDFSHIDEVDWHWADLHHGLDSTLNIVANELKYKAEVVKAYGEIPLIECIPSQLNQIFMNLLVNSAHAIEEHGAITIRTGSEDESVWVDIEDTGKGMSEEVQKRIFEPFFTTKPVGKGTGLGLSLAYGIVQKHNGRIDIQSEEGKGTKFRITLPIAHMTENTDKAE